MCNTRRMGVDNRRERLARAGAWLRDARSRRYPKAVDFAEAIGIERSLLSRYETGVSEVPDERAQAIAEALGLDIITVRRGLGKWIPEEVGGQAPADDDDPKFQRATELLAEGMALLEEIRQERRQGA